MPVRHFYLLSHYICNGLLFLFSACWLQKDECNSLWGQLRGRRQMSITTQKVFLSAIFTCSHSTFVMVYYFYFLCFGSRRNECNSLLEREGGEVRSLLLTLSAMLNLFSSFTDDKMILQFIAVHDTFIIILSQYIFFINACHTLYDAHLASRIPRHS